MGAIRIKRIYEAVAADDGRRVLVDRLWPRGLKRDAAAVDLWLKEVAPSAALRRWFDHDPQRWTEFQKRYRAELAANPQAAKLRQLARTAGTVTLLFAAKDAERNNAEALRNWLRPKAPVPRAARRKVAP